MQHSGADFNHHCLALIPLCPYLSLKTQFCAFKGELFFLFSLSFHQRDGPFSVSMGFGPSCCSWYHMASVQFSHLSLLLVSFIFLCLTCFILCLFFRLDLS